MIDRICPECDTKSEDAVCPKCGSRTLRDLRKEERVDPMLGRVLDDRYRIDALIGRGGMGAVYRGLQLATKQVVAIKVIRSEHAEDLEAAKRFHREARAASLLTHPNTIRVFDFGQSETGDLHMVMEHLVGCTLSKARRAEGRFSEARIAKIAGEICRSLAEAHSHGLAHRDLKPDNVMLLDTVGDPDFVKVLDFGIAKFLSGGSSGESSVTRTGAVVGTPHYMSPEQARGSRGLTPAVDIYALGVIVWEALAGVRPFEGESALNILMAHARQPVPDLPDDCGASPAMRALVSRLLGKDPAGRPSATELVRSFETLRMQAMLSAAAVEAGPGAPPATPPRATSSPATPHPTKAGVADAELESTIAIRSQDEPGGRRTAPMGTAAESAPAEGGATATRDASSIMAPARRVRLPWVIVGLVIAGSAGFGLYRALASETVQDPAVSEPPRANEVEPAPAPAGRAPVAEAPVAVAPVVVAGGGKEPVPAPLSPPTAPPRTLRVLFESDPPGAIVRLGDRDLGTTPFDAELPAGGGALPFGFRKAGFRDATVKAEVVRDARVAARLERARAGTATRSRPAPAPAAAPVPAADPAPAKAPVSAPPPKRKFLPVDD